MENVTIKNISFISTSLEIQVEVEIRKFKDEEIWGEEFKAEVKKALQDTPWAEFKDYLEFDKEAIYDIRFHNKKRSFVLIPVREIGW